MTPWAMRFMSVSRFQRKAIDALSFAEKNTQASLDYAESLLHARDLPGMMRLHGDYEKS